MATTSLAGTARQAVTSPLAAVQVATASDMAMTGAELKQARQRLGLSQEKMAALLGVKPSTQWRWEAGRRHVPEPVAAYVSHLLEEHTP